MKRCTKCGEDRPLDLFARDKRCPDGRSSCCKVCKKAYSRQYYANHSEERRQYFRERRKNNPDDIRAIKKRYRTAHKEEIAQRKRLARQSSPERFKAIERRGYYKNREKIRSYNRAYYPRWYDQNKQNRKQVVKRWRSLNTDRLISYKHTRRARRLANGGRYTRQQWEELKQAYNHQCACCGKVKPLTVDHIIPISRGGSNDISNIQPLCMRCNKSKFTKAIDYRQEQAL